MSDIGKQQIQPGVTGAMVGLKAPGAAGLP